MPVMKSPNGAPERTNLELLLSALEDWGEQLKQTDIKALLESVDGISPDSDDAEPPSGPEYGGPQP